MNSKLLLKGLPKLKDERGKDVCYDMPVLVFSPSIRKTPLEQIVPAIYFRGGEDFINKPYSVKIVEQPLTKFYANQLALRSFSQIQVNSWNDLATYFASEHVLITLPAKEYESVSQMEAQFEQAESELRKFEQGSSSLKLDEIMGLFYGAISSATCLRVPTAVSSYMDYLKNFRKHTDSQIAAHFDKHRRIVVKSLQITEGSSMEALDGLIEHFYKQPTLKNARLVDVFARDYINLGFESDARFCLESAIKAYEKFISLQPDPKQKESAYASLISLDMMSRDYRRAEQHSIEMYDLGLKFSSKTLLIQNALSRLSENPSMPAENLSIPKIETGFGKFYYPGLLSIMDDRLDRFLEGDGKYAWAPSRIDLMESFLKYSKKTVIKDIFYEQRDGRLMRHIVFNQNPFFQFKDAVESIQPEEAFLITQFIDRNYFGKMTMAAHYLGRNPYKYDRFFGDAAVPELLASDVDKCFADVMDIDSASFNADLTLRVYHSQKPKLSRKGFNGLTFN